MTNVFLQERFIHGDAFSLRIISALFQLALNVFLELCIGNYEFLVYIFIISFSNCFNIA